MSYTALPDRRMPYDNDGTVVAYGVGGGYASAADFFAQGIAGYLTGADRIELNDRDFAGLVAGAQITYSSGGRVGLWWFFPEQREVTAAVIGHNSASSLFFPATGLDVVHGSSDSTNGVDGTWEVATMPAGYPNVPTSLDGWRSGIKAISFTGAKRVLRMSFLGNAGTAGFAVVLAHLYGEKAAGQTPDDVIFIDHDTTPGVEYAAPEDFGDRPLGTTVTRQFRVKNVSPTLTANSINLQCNDADFAISTDGTTWVTTINIASLASGAESATMYIRNTTPAPGSVLGPRFSRIVAIVGSWT